MTQAYPKIKVSALHRNVAFEDKPVDEFIRDLQAALKELPPEERETAQLCYNRFDETLGIYILKDETDEQRRRRVQFVEGNKILVDFVERLQQGKIAK